MLDPKVGQQLRKGLGYYIVPAAVSENDKGRGIDHSLQPPIFKLLAREPSNCWGT